MLYNIGQRKGIVYNKLFYKRYHKKDLHLAMNDMTLSDNENDNEESIDLSREEELDYQLYFRTCMLPRDKEILKIKLRKSISMREQMMKRTKMEFHEIFPFYFLDSDLVSFSSRIFSNLDLNRIFFRLFSIMNCAPMVQIPIL